VCEQVFAKTLQGHSLVSNKSIWRNFPWLWHDRWSFRNMVLVGDALRTAHFSIGSGTRLAMEDVIALVSALEAESGNLAAGLKLYEAKRRPVVETLVSAAKASADWYEPFPEHMRLAPLDFAMAKRDHPSPRRPGVLPARRDRAAHRHVKSYRPSLSTVVPINVVPIEASLARLSRSFRTTTPMSTANTTPVSRSAETSANGASVSAQITTQAEP
jgi:hypothetical protein